MPRVTGALFSGQSHGVVKSAIREIEDKVAQRGANLVQVNLAGSLQNPTGYYQSHIITDRSTHTRVWDQNVVYGNWLEGTGSRNKTTRFKGYQTFRKTTAQLQAEAPRIAEQVLAKYLGRMS